MVLYDENLEAYYEMDDSGRREYEVAFIYEDYGEDEEPELRYIRVWAVDEEDAKSKAEYRFTPIQVVEVKPYIEEYYGAFHKA